MKQPLLLVAVCALVLVASSAGALTYSVLYAFKGTPDGDEPLAAVVLDEAGNIYGTTAYAGTSQECTRGCGAVFKLGADGKEIVLHGFLGPTNDGEEPNAPVVLDEQGNLYGTTYLGGLLDWGTVFKLDNEGKETILHSFGPPPGDGIFPFGAGLVRDEAGNLYGTTAAGGANGLGTIFKVEKNGKESVIYSLQGASLWPFAGLFRDKFGNLYGTSFGEGYSTYGTVFRLSKAGKFTIVHQFTGGTDGGRPESVLVQDRYGNVYGTTVGGGDLNCAGRRFLAAGSFSR